MKQILLHLRGGQAAERVGRIVERPSELLGQRDGRNIVRKVV